MNSNLKLYCWAWGSHNNLIRLNYGTDIVVERGLYADDIDIDSVGCFIRLCFDCLKALKIVVDKKIEREEWLRLQKEEQRLYLQAKRVIGGNNDST